MGELGPLELKVSGKIANEGDAKSPPCQVKAEVWVLQPYVSLPGRPPAPGHGVLPGGPPVALPPVTQQCPALAPGTSVEVGIGSVQIQDTGAGVHVRVCVDPPSQGKPGGEVWESREDDNCMDEYFWMVDPSSHDEPILPPDRSPTR